MLAACANPRCDVFEGDSEAGQPLKRCERKCRGEVAYCCVGCQRAHWKAEHKQQCGNEACDTFCPVNVNCVEGQGYFLKYGSSPWRLGGGEDRGVERTGTGRWRIDANLKAWGWVLRDGLRSTRAWLDGHPRIGKKRSGKEGRHGAIDLKPGAG